MQLTVVVEVDAGCRAAHRVAARLAAGRDEDLVVEHGERGRGATGLTRV